MKGFPTKTKGTNLSLEKSSFKTKMLKVTQTLTFTVPFFL